MAPLHPAVPAVLLSKPWNSHGGVITIDAVYDQDAAHWPPFDGVVEYRIGSSARASVATSVPWPSEICTMTVWFGPCCCPPRVPSVDVSERAIDASEPSGWGLFARGSTWRTLRKFSEVLRTCRLARSRPPGDLLAPKVCACAPSASFESSMVRSRQPVQCEAKIKRAPHGKSSRSPLPCPPAPGSRSQRRLEALPPAWARGHCPVGSRRQQYCDARSAHPTRRWSM